jgi:ABC-2 type transport system permease protein
MILYMTILLYGVSVQRSVLEDKSSRIVEVLLSSTRPFHLLLGKVLGVAGVGLTQYAIWGAVAMVASAYVRTTSPALANFTAIPPGALVYFAVYFLLGYLLYAALFAATGSMVNSDQEAQQLQWPVTMLLVVPIIFMQGMFRDPDSTTSVVMSLIPFFSPILMMLRINLHTPPAWQIGLSIVILVLSVLAVTAIAARIFRVGILMYGKRPTLPELMRWVREG